MTGIQRITIVTAIFAILAVPGVASAYCQAVLRNPFNGRVIDRFSAPTCSEAMAKCQAYAHGPQICRVASGY